MIEMEVPEKWRGKRLLLNQDIVYGTLTNRGIWTAIANKDGIFRVFDDSLQKLAGYDENGNEVYRSYKK
ncbi:MAG: hypothetical protein IJS29_08180 [Selenomonadaceae bacterium]|nr:hypothetical protein [Selenomonadaceae bacterium]